MKNKFTTSLPLDHAYWEMYDNKPIKRTITGIKITTNDQNKEVYIYIDDSGKEISEDILLALPTTKKDLIDSL